MATRVSLADPYVNVVYVHWLFGALLFSSCGLWFDAIWADPDLLQIASGMLTGWVSADFVSCCVHAIIDSNAYTRVARMVAGSTGGRIHTVVDSHHDSPNNYDTLTDTELVALTYPVTIPLLLLFRVSTPDPHVFAAVCQATMMILGLASSHIHRWSHSWAVGGVVKALQDAGIILSQTAHHAHHITHDCGYSLINGVTQDLFDAILSMSSF